MIARLVGLSSAGEGNRVRMLVGSGEGHVLDRETGNAICGDMDQDAVGGTGPNALAQAAGPT